MCALCCYGMPMPIVVIERFHAAILYLNVYCTICSVYVNVDMNLNVCIMLHRHLRELRAISVLFVTVKFRLLRLPTDDIINILLAVCNCVSIHTHRIDLFFFASTAMEISIFCTYLLQGVEMERKTLTLTFFSAVPPSSISDFITR